MPVQCPKCKALNRDTTTFCDGCGVSLIIGADQAVPARAMLRPDFLPEEQFRPGVLTRPSGPPPSIVSFQPRPTVRPPRARPGSLPRRHLWRWYFLFVLAIGVISGAFVAVNEERGELFFQAGSFFAAIALIVGLPILLWRKSSNSMGIVTHLREWSPQSNPRLAIRDFPNWVFNLRLTDEQGNPLADRRGFLLPIVEVEFRTDKVHGPPLEEGSQVILRGKWKRKNLRAVEIWNCSPAMQTPVLGAGAVFLGQVTQLQSSSAPDMRYPGQPRSLQIMSFRLQLTDENFQLLRDTQGNLLPSSPVEIRAQAISGPIGDGDKVEIHGQVVNGILYTREVYNHSAGGAPVVVREWAGIS